MAETSFRLEIVTPEGVVYDHQVTSLVLPTVDGLMGVLPNHAPLVAAVDIGEVRAKEADGGEHYCMVTDGFLEIANNHVRILADAGENAEDIDTERAAKSEERARERLAKRGERDFDFDVTRTERSLQRAMWRQIIARRRGR